MNQTNLLLIKSNKTPKNLHFKTWQLQQEQQLASTTTIRTTILEHDTVGVVKDSYYIPVENPADSSNNQHHQQQSKNRLNNNNSGVTSSSSRNENISFKQRKNISYNSSRNSSRRLSKSQQNISRQNINFKLNSSKKNLSDKISIKTNSENWSWPSYLMNLNKDVVGRKLNLTNENHQLDMFHIDVMHDNNEDVEPDEQDYQHVEDIDDDDDENFNDDDDDDDNNDFFNLSDNEHDTMLKTSQKSTLQSQQQQQQQLHQQQQQHTSQSDLIKMRSLKSRRHIAITSTLAPLRYLIESYEIPASNGEQQQQQQHLIESENNAARSRRDSRAFVGSVGGMSGIGLPASGFTNFYNRPPSLPTNQQQQPQLPISDYNNNYNYFHKQFSQQHPQQSQQPTPTQVQHRFTNFQHIQHQQHQPFYHQHQRFFPTQQQPQQSTYGPKIIKQQTPIIPAVPKPMLPILPTAHFPIMTTTTTTTTTTQPPPPPTTQQAHVNVHQHQHQHHHHHHHHKHAEHQPAIEYTTQKHVVVVEKEEEEEKERDREEEVPKSSFPVQRPPTLFPAILLPTHYRPRQQQQHRKHHHPRRYCSARDPAQLAYEAPTVFEGRIVSMTPDRRANFSATVEVKEVYKQQIGSYRLQKYLRLQFSYRNTTSECDIYREQLRQRGLVRGDELEQGRIYLMFVQQVDLGNFTILGQPMKKTRRVVEAVKEAVSENYAQLAKIRSITATNRTVENGKELRIVCRVQGRPPPKVTWFKDHKSINRNRKLYQFVHLKKRSELIIRSFNSSDAGRYECRAKNKVNSNLERRAIIIKAYPVPRYETHLTGGTGNNCPADASEFCFNGGTCKFFAEIASYSCICPEGFVGERCDRKEVNNMPPSTYSNEQECGEKKFLGSYYC